MYLYALYSIPKFLHCCLQHLQWHLQWSFVTYYIKIKGVLPRLQGSMHNTHDLTYTDNFSESYRYIYPGYCCGIDFSALYKSPDWNVESPDIMCMCYSCYPGNDRGPVLEVIVSRTNFISSHTERKVRVIGLSTALANARDLADWLGIGQVRGGGILAVPETSKDRA